MTNVKKMAACVAAFVCVMVTVFGMTSCQGSEDVKMTQAAPKTITVKEEVPVPYLVEKDKLYPVLSNVLISDHNIFINGKSVATYEVKHQFPTIEMPAADHKEAGIVSFDGETLRDSNGQQTKISVNIVSGSDYTLNATITPNEEYSKITRLHAKVSMVTCYFTLSGYVTVTIDGETKPNDFSLTIARHYLLVDPSIDVETIVRTDTIEKLVVKTDTLINTVEVEKIVEKVVNHTDTIYVDKVITSTDTLFVERVIEVEKTVTLTDTIQVEVERFVKGADINKAVVNDLGFSEGTLTLGDKLLLKIMLNHKEPVLNVEQNVLGNVSFAATGSLVWNGSDSQVTSGTKESNNVTVKSFDFIRCEYTKVSETMVIVRTIYVVTGSFYNENSDLCEFSMELAPSYLQKYDEPVVTPQEETKPLYRGIIRKVSAEGLKLMTKPVVQQLVDGQWQDIRTCSRVCVGLSGSPSGLDLFVKSRKVVEENEESHWYVATGNADMDKQWVGEDSKTDGTVVYRNTKVYDFNYMFAADAVNNGLVGPQTQLYVMRAERVQVTDPDGNLMTCTWEDGSEFSLNLSVKLNDTSYVDDPALVGTTRVESDKTYKYETTFTQNFTASIGGKELQNVESKSPLWLPVE